jgi:hypothetical protein
VGNRLKERKKIKHKDKSERERERETRDKDKHTSYLYLTKHSIMKASGEAEVQIHPFLFSALGRVWSALRSKCLVLGQQLIRRLGGPLSQS